MIYDTKKIRILISKDTIFDKEKVWYLLLDHTIVNKEKIFLFDSMLDNHTSQDKVSINTPNH